MATDNNNSELLTTVVAHAIYAVCIFLFIKYGFVTAQHCDIDKQYLYCHLHPMGGLAIVGMILFFGGWLFNSKLLNLVFGEIMDQKAAVYAAVAGVISMIGIGLIFAS